MCKGAGENLVSFSLLTGMLHVQGRRVQLEYMSYTDERMRPLRFYMQTAVRSSLHQSLFLYGNSTAAFICLIYALLEACG